MVTRPWQPLRCREDPASGLVRSVLLGSTPALHAQRFCTHGTSVLYWPGQPPHESCRAHIQYPLPFHKTALWLDCVAVRMRSELTEAPETHEGVDSSVHVREDEWR